MCYATNSLGSKQKFIELEHEDRNNKKIAFSYNSKAQKDLLMKNFKLLKRSYDQVFIYGPGAMGTI